jgi:hypothetical protein
MTRTFVFISLLTTIALAACGPCEDSGRRAPAPGPNGPVIVAADMCDGEDGSETGIATGTDGASSTAPTDTTEDTGDTEGASETGAECPMVECDGNGACPEGTGTCMQGQCLITCPCQAMPGECAVSFGGPVTFCPAAAAPKC